MTQKGGCTVVHIGQLNISAENFQELLKQVPVGELIWTHEAGGVASLQKEN